MSQATDVGAPLVRISDAAKSFGAVQALRGVSLEAAAGEVVGLIGANGAGKSTLMKVLSGMVSPDAGVATVDGETIGSPQDAVRLGVAVVAQELRLVDSETVAHNVFLGRLPARAFWVRHGLLYDRTCEVLERVGLGREVDPRQTAGSLAPAQQRLVSIAQALSADPRVLILDEPTAALPADTVRVIGNIIAALSAAGTTVIYVSHRLNEVEEFTDNVLAMRDGAEAGQLRGPERTVPRMVELVGGSARWEEPAPVVRSTAKADVILTARGLSGRRVRDVDLDLRQGELVGVGGLFGSGRSELLRLLVGLQQKTGGSVELFGQRGPRSIREASRLGVGYVAEERRNMIFPSMDVVANTTIASMGTLSRGGIVTNRAAERAVFQEMADQTGLVGAADAPMRTLSGGNQQKILLARWLVHKPKLLVLDEPTVGVDVHARAELHRLLRSLAESGTTILVACAEPEELVTLCERVIVLAEGHLADELQAPFEPDAVVAASYRYRDAAAPLANP